MQALRILALLCAGSLVVSRPAFGQTTIKDAPQAGAAEAAAALQHFRLGVEWYRQGNYAAARVEFEAAYGLSKIPDLLHNLSETAEKQGQIAEAIDYEEQFLAGQKELTNAETDQARGRILRLRERQNKGTAAASPKQPEARQQSPTAAAARSRWVPPAPAIGLVAGGGIALIVGIACGGAALATGRQLASGQALTLAEIDAARTRGESLNTAAITFDILGGVALGAGVAWSVVDFVQQRHRDRVAMFPGVRSVFPGVSTE